MCSLLAEVLQYVLLESNWLFAVTRLVMVVHYAYVSPTSWDRGADQGASLTVISLSFTWLFLMGAVNRHNALALT